MTNTRDLDEFIIKSTRTFFDQLEIETIFREQESAIWEQHEGCMKQHENAIAFQNNIEFA